ncbi:TPA: hypothetical protein SMP57_001002 [Proteus mirabilis]|nr:hypothetical protein [Proteus mirabilis]HEK2691865.1 hypothetical protein [Proteus mirabilis]
MLASFQSPFAEWLIISSFIKLDVTGAPYSPYHPPTQTDQYTPSDNTHTHMDSAHPITLSGLGKDTTLSP